MNIISFLSYLYLLLIAPICIYIFLYSKTKGKMRENNVEETSATLNRLGLNLINPFVLGSITLAAIKKIYSFFRMYYYHIKVGYSYIQVKRDLQDLKDLQDKFYNQAGVKPFQEMIDAVEYREREYRKVLKELYDIAGFDFFKHFH